MTFLSEPPATPEAQALYAEDLEGDGYVMNLTRLWAWQPGLHDRLVGLIGAAGEAASLTMRQKGVLVAACASTLGDSCCSFAWGTRLAGETEPAVAAAVLRGDDSGLDPVDRALAAWARKVARDPNGTTADDVQELRDAGFDDGQVFAVTAYVAIRLAFSTVNDALGAAADAELRAAAPAEVRDAVTYGR
jgi:alkylhydroperoxidase family enzyme